MSSACAAGARIDLLLELYPPAVDSLWQAARHESNLSELSLRDFSCESPGDSDLVLFLAGRPEPSRSPLPPLRRAKTSGRTSGKNVEMERAEFGRAPVDLHVRCCIRHRGLGCDRDEPIIDKSSGSDRDYRGIRDRGGLWTEFRALFDAQSLHGVDGRGAASGDHTRNASGNNQNGDSYRHDA